MKLSDGREFKAKVIGRDETTDLALIKITDPAGNLPTLVLGDSEKMRVGDWVLAIGNPFGLEHTVTQGVISATGRVIGSGPYDDFLQTDAPINPGNSGGPLVNLRGEVIGINTAIFSGGQGLGFALPSALATSVVAQLREKGKVVRGFTGVVIQSVTPELAKITPELRQQFGSEEKSGVIVVDDEQWSLADAAGIKKGDVIEEVNRVKVGNLAEFNAALSKSGKGEAVLLLVKREKQTFFVTLEGQ